MCVLLGGRLERLRKVVPHAERANTATFLEQVLTYIEDLKRTVEQLEDQVRSKDAELKQVHQLHLADSL